LYEKTPSSQTFPSQEDRSSPYVLSELNSLRFRIKKACLFINFTQGTPFGNVYILTGQEEYILHSEETKPQVGSELQGLQEDKVLPVEVTIFSSSPCVPGKEERSLLGLSKEEELFAEKGGGFSEIIGVLFHCDQIAIALMILVGRMATMSGNSQFI
jgi:hypothetical protein